MQRNCVAHPRCFQSISCMGAELGGQLSWRSWDLQTSSLFRGDMGRLPHLIQPFAHGAKPSFWCCIFLNPSLRCCLSGIIMQTLSSQTYFLPLLSPAVQTGPGTLFVLASNTFSLLKPLGILWSHFVLVLSRKSVFHLRLASFPAPLSHLEVNYRVSTPKTLASEERSQCLPQKAGGKRTVLPKFI
jgi:hypothetical protein